MEINGDSLHAPGRMQPYWERAWSSPVASSGSMLGWVSQENLGEKKDMKIHEMVVFFTNSRAFQNFQEVQQQIFVTILG